MATNLQKREGNEWLPEFSQVIDVIKTTGAERAAQEKTGESYYGVPMLKRPLWRWEIAFYFFLEGVSSGAFLIGGLAKLFGNGSVCRLSRAGYYVASASLLPCPPLLIADLGRPGRFHHMLRVFKPSSPMNLGAWALTSYSLPLTLLTASQLIEDGWLSGEAFNNARKLLPERVASGAGLPFALMMIIYPGVLLSTTSTPIWTKSRFLGALFACSSINTGAAAVSLALTVSGDRDHKALLRVGKLQTLAAICEGASLAAFLATSGETARPLVIGGYKWHFWLGAVGAGLVFPEILRAQSRKKAGKNLLANILGPALTLAGGLALKWAMVHAGKESAEDVEASRATSRPTRSAPGWAPDWLRAIW